MAEVAILPQSCSMVGKYLCQLLTAKCIFRSRRVSDAGMYDPSAEPQLPYLNDLREIRSYVLDRGNLGRFQRCWQTSIFGVPTAPPLVALSSVRLLPAQSLDACNEKLGITSGGFNEPRSFVNKFAEGILRLFETVSS